MRIAAEHTLGSNIQGFLERKSDAILLEPIAGSDEAQLEATSPQRAKRPKPAWWLLYAMIPLTALLFMLADLLPPETGWRSGSELLAALVLFCAIGLWLRANRIALILAACCDQSESPREML